MRTERARTNRTNTNSLYLFYLTRFYRSHFRLSSLQTQRMPRTGIHRKRMHRICCEIQHSLENVCCICTRSARLVSRYSLHKIFLRALFVPSVCCDLLQVNTGLNKIPKRNFRTFFFRSCS